MLLTWISIAIATVAACELIVRLPLLAQVRAARDTAQKAFGLMRNSHVSDHWKELVIPRYALMLAGSSLAALALLLLALAPFFLIMVAGAALNMNIIGMLSAWSGILVSCIIAFTYLSLRKRLGVARTVSDKDRTSYSTLDRVLHSLALGSAARGEMLLGIEHKFAPAPPPEAAEGRHVLVSGLARAGTTVLMRAINDSGNFASLTYRDMPFVMAPNLWARLTSRTRVQMAKTERAHGDGLLVDFDSPEALEEPFWRCFFGRDYIRPDALQPHMVDEHGIERYRHFVNHVLARYGASRYLAKNNNGLLRLEAWHEAFPHALVVIPFRHPQTQARSLQTQHERFKTQDDPFITRYMGWLCHHEFGADHRPFKINGQRPQGTPDDTDYWLQLWLIAYRHLAGHAQQHPQTVLPIAYEDLCDPTGWAWPALVTLLDISPPAHSPFRSDAQQASIADNTSLGAEADALYDELRQLSRAKIGAIRQARKGNIK